jgi:hypothetical protein
METFEQLRSLRIAWGIPLRQIHKRLDCSYTWIRDLEYGYHHGIPSSTKWQRKYQSALEEIIEEKKEKIKSCS